MTRAGLDRCGIPVSDRDRADAFHRDAPGAEASPRRAGFACRFGPAHLDAHAPGGRAAPGNSGLCFARDGTEAEAPARLARHGVAAALGPASRNAARGRGVSLDFRDPDRSLIEFIIYP